MKNYHGYFMQFLAAISLAVSLVFSSVSHADPTITNPGYEA